MNQSNQLQELFDLISHPPSRIPQLQASTTNKIKEELLSDPPLNETWILYNKSILNILQKNPELLNQVENGENLMLPIHYACKQGNRTLVSFMISKGSRVDDKDARERTPLYFAIESKNFELIKLLYENEKVTKIVPDAFFHAAELNLFQVVKYMMEYHDSYLKKRKQEYIHIHGKLPKKLKKIYSRIHKPLHEYKDTIENSILHVAASSGASLIVQYLVEKWKMDIEDRSVLGFTPLFNAVSEGHEETALLLYYKYNAKTHWRSNVGRSLLHYACDKGNIKLINLFLELGLNPNEKDTATEWTSLHFAASKNRLEAVQLLLSLPNIEFNALDKAKKRAIDYTTSDKVKEILHKTFLARASLIERLDYNYTLFVKYYYKRLIALSLSFLFIWIVRKFFL